MHIYLYTYTTNLCMQCFWSMNLRTTTKIYIIFINYEKIYLTNIERTLILYTYRDVFLVFSQNEK